MKTALMVCSTPYQIMIAAILRMQCLNKEDSVDLIITDTFSNYDVIAERIRKTCLYRDVYIATVKKLLTVNTIKEKFDKLLFLIFFKNGLEKAIRKKLECYDEMYFNNDSIFTYNLMSILYIKNPHCKFIKFEEGYISYTLERIPSIKSKRLVSFRNRLINIKISLEPNSFYVLMPELIMHDYNYPILNIDKNILTQKDYTDFISFVFQTDKAAESYNRKCIIFEESFAADGIDIDDIELYKSVIDLVGAENITVKMHPRSLKNRFEQQDLDIHLPDGIPWEAVILSPKFNKSTVFLTLASGSVTSSRMLLNDTTPSFLLYKCLNKRPSIWDSNFEKFIENFQNKCGGNIVIPNNKTEMLEYISELIK